MTSEPKRQVYILGAGASVDLELPIGSELTGQIQSALSFKDDRFRPSGGDRLLLEALMRSGEQHKDWFKACQLIAKAMPLAPSIDNFVDVHRDNPSIAFCAKAAITSCILNAERKSTIYVKPDNIYNTVDFQGNIGTWHTLFFRMLTMYCTVENLEERLRQIAIVTFNYDRCFEHFLFHAIKTYYEISDAKAAGILKNLDIYHPYGQVGQLPHATNVASVAYGQELQPSRLIEISKQIRTFTESTKGDSSDINEIREVVFNASTLIFLGFAFHPLNVRLLLPSTSSGKNYQKRVFATAFGASPSDVTNISWELASRYGCDPPMIQLRADLKCSELLSEYSRTLAIE